MDFRLTIVNMLMLTLATAASVTAESNQPYPCQPTPEDEMGPFYRPGAPERHQVGTGYLQQGTVKSASDCRSIPDAKVELWMTGPEGRYGDDWRATLYSADNGSYYFQSHAATNYASRPPHIHIKVSAQGYTALITQHYPLKDAGIGVFDLVLIPKP